MKGVKGEKTVRSTLVKVKWRWEIDERGERKGKRRKEKKGRG